MTRRSGIAAGFESPLIPTLASKLHVPHPPQHLVLRRRLLDVLDGGSNKRLTLLSAPAGFGKTVLLASWIRRGGPRGERAGPGAGRGGPGGGRGGPGPGRGGPEGGRCGPASRAGWLSVDRDDNDPSRLLADLLSALQSAGLLTAGGPLEGLVGAAGASGEEFLTLLLNGLAEQQQSFVLVIDDAHELTSPQAVETLDYLVRHAPPSCRIVLAARADPVLPIGRLRIGEELTELRIGELAFDRGETAELFEPLGLGLSEDELDLLWARTEGWAAALRLASLSLHNHPEPRRFLADFAGTDRAIADYLMSEILGVLPEETRRFLLRTSLVDTVDPELADCLVGVDGYSAGELAMLERSGAPVQALPSDASGRRAVRYHPLFRGFLAAHLRHAHPEEVPALHRRAALWYAHDGQVSPAIEHALAGADWTLASQLIVERWLELHVGGRSREIGRLLANCPSDLREADPLLALAYAGARLQEGEVDEAERQLALARRAREGLTGARRERLTLSLTVVGLQCARARGNVKEADRLAQKLLGLAQKRPQHSWSALRSLALVSAGATRLWTLEGHPSLAQLEEALALASDGDHELQAMDCLAQLAVMRLLRSELERATELSAQALTLAARNGWSDGPGGACAHLAAGSCAYWRGEFVRAQELMAHAAAVAPTAEPAVAIAAELGRIAALATDPSAGERAALKMRALRARAAGLERVPDFLSVMISSVGLRVMALAGEHGEVREMLAESDGSSRQPAELLVRRASVELLEGDLPAAARSLAPVLRREREERASTSRQPAPGADEPQRRTSWPTLIEAWLLRARIEQAEGHSAEAGDALEQALELAEREPYRNAFLLGGSGALELLESQAQGQSEHPALLEVLLGELGERSSQRPATIAEPLTERELRILRYLPTMLSNSEIGAELFVSLNTVKTHLRSIYRKLDAGSRAEAVERARQLGLLPSGIKRSRIRARRRPAQPSSISASVASASATPTMANPATQRTLSSS
jgi:LuxR family transcriptional regulator, maltose regulon positive regulatory protein